MCVVAKLYEAKLETAANDAEINASDDDDDDGEGKEVEAQCHYIGRMV